LGILGLGIALLEVAVSRRSITRRDRYETGSGYIRWNTAAAAAAVDKVDYASGDASDEGLARAGCCVLTMAMHENIICIQPRNRDLFIASYGCCGRPFSFPVLAIEHLPSHESKCG
jgi:hypothetical protein